MTERFAGPHFQERTIGDYWLAIYRQKHAIALVVISAVVLAAGLSLILPPVYEARTVFYVPAPLTQPLLEKGSVVPFPSGLQVEAKAYVKVLSGNSIQEKVRRKLPNAGDLGRKVDLSASSEGLITIYVRDRNPELAAAIANEYVTAFNEFSEENARATISHSIKAIDQQVGEFSKDLVEASSALKAFQANNTSAVPKTEMEEMVRHRQTLERDLEVARSSLKVLQDQLRNAKSSASGSNVYLAADLGLNNPVIELLRKTMAELEIKLASLRTQVTAIHPEVIALQEQYEQSRRGLESELTRMIEVTETRIKGLSDVIASLDERIRAKPVLIERANILDQELQRSFELLSAALKQREELRVQELRGYTGAVVVDKATPPGSPVFPNLVVNVIMSVILGLIGGVIYAFILQYLTGMKGLGQTQESVTDEVLISGLK